jgi:hypothetical protein
MYCLRDIDELFSSSFSLLTGIRKWKDIAYTYLGEKGFLLYMPPSDQNTHRQNVNTVDKGRGGGDAQIKVASLNHWREIEWDLTG